MSACSLVDKQHKFGRHPTWIVWRYSMLGNFFDDYNLADFKFLV